MQFSKYHGLGNDYIIINEFQHEIIAEARKSDIAIWLCQRKFSVGADGVLFVCPPTTSEAQIRMRIFNIDGSEAEMCGNGIRCFAKYVHEKMIINDEIIKVETLAGIKYPSLLIEDNQVNSIRVDMGEPKLLRSEIPMKGKNTRIIDEELKIAQNIYRATCVSMGNPHCVIFVTNLQNLDIERGKAIEYNPLFPKRTNVEFVEIVTPQEIKMRVWERGVGETLACGTGACAATVASILNQKTDRNITVHLLGGDLDVHWASSNNHVYMTGPAEHIFDGEIELYDE
jgi:diaminopimelate epimerase